MTLSQFDNAPEMSSRPQKMDRDEAPAQHPLVQRHRDLDRVDGSDVDVGHGGDADHAVDGDDRTGGGAEAEVRKDAGHGDRSRRRWRYYLLAAAVRTCRLKVATTLRVMKAARQLE